MNKQNKGITLIALIITIIVMLILVAVTLTIALGDNGILKKARDAKSSQDAQQEKEAEVFLSDSFGTAINSVVDGGSATISTVLDSGNNDGEFEYNSLYGYNDDGDEYIIYIYKSDNIIYMKNYKVEDNDFTDLSNIKSVDDIKVKSKGLKYLKEVDKNVVVTNLQNKLSELSDDKDIEACQSGIDFYGNTNIVSPCWYGFQDEEDAGVDIEDYYAALDYMIGYTKDEKISDCDSVYSKLADSSEASRLVSILDADTADLKTK